MTGNLIGAVGLAGIVLLAQGCRSAGSVRSEVTQVAALSNEVSRLSQRLDSVEQESRRLKSDMQPLLRLMDHIGNEPVVQEELRAAP